MLTISSMPNKIAVFGYHPPGRRRPLHSRLAAATSLGPGAWRLGMQHSARPLDSRGITALMREVVIITLPDADMSKEKEARDIADVQVLEQEFKELVPLLELFCDEIAHQIAKLLDDADVTLGFPVQRRVKTWKSLSEKFGRLPRFTHVREIQDLVGLRIILLFKRDIEKAVRLIQTNFRIVRQYDTQERLNKTSSATRRNTSLWNSRRSGYRYPLLAEWPDWLPRSRLGRFPSISGRRLLISCSTNRKRTSRLASDAQSTGSRLCLKPLTWNSSGYLKNESRIEVRLRRVRLRYMTRD